MRIEIRYQNMSRIGIQYRTVVEYVYNTEQW